MQKEGECAVVVRQRHLIAVVVRGFLIGCAVLVLMVGCAGTRSGSSKEEQGNAPQATQSEAEARCDRTGTTKNPSVGTGGGAYTTNDLPGCPDGGLLLGTDKSDRLHSKDADDEIRGLGAQDVIFGGAGKDVIHDGPGNDHLPRGDYRYEGAGDDVIYGGSGDDHVDGGDGADVFYGGDGSDSIIDIWDRQPDKLYCGKGKDEYAADKNDFVSSSCEKKAKMAPPPPPSGPGEDKDKYAA